MMRQFLRVVLKQQQKKAFLQFTIFLKTYPQLNNVPYFVWFLNRLFKHTLTKYKLVLIYTEKSSQLQSVKNRHVFLSVQ